MFALAAITVVLFTNGARRDAQDSCGNTVHCVWL